MDERHAFLSSLDGTRLHVATFGPASPQRGDLVVLGGLAEHAGRYRDVAARLAAAGWRVTVPELRGHGDSEGRRGHVERWSRYVEDLQAVLDSLPGRAWVLAHSMGGLVALDLALGASPRPPAGLALSNPLLAVALDPPAWKPLVAGALSAVLPWLPLGNEIDPALLTHDTAIVEAYRTDPKVFKVVTPRWFTEMRAAQARVLAGAERLRLPVLMVTSDGDRICGFAVARAFADRVPGAVRQDRPGLFHEILNEPERDAILDDILAWIDAHAPTESA